MNAQKILNDCEISEQERADINISKCLRELKIKELKGGIKE